MAHDDQLAVSGFGSLSRPRRGINIRLYRRRGLPSVRLGGERPKRGVLLLRSVWRRMRLKWLRIKYGKVVRQLKEYYCKLVAEIAEASAYADAFHQRVLMEATCAVPMMAGVSFTNVRCDAKANKIMIM